MVYSLLCSKCTRIEELWHKTLGENFNFVSWLWNSRSLTIRNWSKLGGKCSHLCVSTRSVVQVHARKATPWLKKLFSMLAVNISANGGIVSLQRFAWTVRTQKYMCRRAERECARAQTVCDDGGETIVWRADSQLVLLAEVWFTVWQSFRERRGNFYFPCSLFALLLVCCWKRQVKFRLILRLRYEFPFFCWRK